MEWHDWLLWTIAFASLGGPVGALVLDRVVGISGRMTWGLYGLPGLASLAAVCAFTAADGRPLCDLIVWGFVGGTSGTILLDIIRLIGVRFGAFPLDMPQMFGAIALGIAPQLQAHVMAELMDDISRLPDDERRRAMLPRVEAIASMSAARRRTTVAAMMHGLMHLSEERRQAVLRTQMAILSELPSEGRVAVMTTMDGVMAAQSDGDSAGMGLFAPPPLGLPRLPMGTFRRYAERAIPRTLQETRTPSWLLFLTGYTWHVVIGSTFGISFTLLFGRGSWALALGWGVFVWAGMMVLMPAMMPLVRFPRWFPIVPLIAHIAMAIPIGFFALEYVSDSDHEASISGAVRALSLVGGAVGIL